jgi:hypothetical protein
MKANAADEAIRVARKDDKFTRAFKLHNVRFGRFELQE